MHTKLTSPRQALRSLIKKQRVVSITSVTVLSAMLLGPGLQQMLLGHVDISMMPRGLFHVTSAANHASPEPKAASDLSRKQPLEAYGQLPLAFEANKEQGDGQVRFIARGGGYDLFLTAHEAVLVLQLPATRGKQSDHHPALRRVSTPTRGGVLRLKLVGANAAPHARGLEELGGKVNYFIGNDPAKWRTDIPTYAKVQYEDVYPGVDMVYYGNQRRLEYDLIVAPGADPGAIALDAVGSKALRLNPQGEIELEVGGSKVVMRRPDIYQEIDGIRQAVQGDYRLQGSHRFGFQVGSYDPTRPLIIDPVVVYSTFLGGSGGDVGHSVAVDGAGNAYVIGNTGSPNFPTAPPFQNTFGGVWDAFVTKLNPAGNAVIYSTYLGGNGQEFGNGIALDGAGNAYVTGTTNSTNFPTMTPFQNALSGSGDAFVAKLSPAGTMVYSTYLGGGGGLDDGNDIAVNNAGNAYVTGRATSNFPTTVNSSQAVVGGNTDAFVAELNTVGNALVYSTFLGGSGGDEGHSIDLDTAGNAYVTGLTYSSNFPTVTPIQGTLSGGGDAFVSKLNVNGSALIYSTFLGGNSGEVGSGIAVDGAGNAYVTGSTSSSDFPTVSAFQPAFGGLSNDVFVTKLNPAGSALIYSTFLGGSGRDDGNDIALDGAGNAYITGWTNSMNFPTMNPYQVPPGPGVIAAFMSQLNASGALSFSTYLGSTVGEYGWGIAVDGAGNAYVTGLVNSSIFPTVNPYQATFGGSSDAFVIKLAIPAPCVGPPQADLWMKDTMSPYLPEDFGVEPNNTAPLLYISRDIWVRTSADTTVTSANPGPDTTLPTDRYYTNEHQHQDPTYVNSSTYSYVYVKVRNRGCASSTGTEVLRVYWANASTGLPWPGTGIWNEFDCVAGAGVNPCPLPAIAPGQDYVVRLPWLTPNPAAFGGSSHFCLVARIETQPSPPFGMTVAEGPLLWANVAENNNIVWKNLAVFPGVSGSGKVIVRNTLRHETALALRFAVPQTELKNHFLLHGDIFVDLGEAVMKKWRRGGRRSRGFAVVGKTTIKITDPTDALLDGLLFSAGEEQTIEVRMQLKSRDRSLAGTSFNWDVIQMAPLTKNAEPRQIGGQRYVLIVPKAPDRKDVRKR